MPEVGFDRTPVRKDLNTVEGGYVELRRLPYDEILKRREMATRLSMEGGSDSRSRRTRQEREEANKIAIELAQVATREYEFKNCIVDHNLTVDGNAVDFSKPALAFKMVNPKVLQEIELLLAELNEETDEDELRDFTNVAKHSSSDDTNSPPVITEAS